MNTVIIKKIAEVTAVEMLIEASERDSFEGTAQQFGTLPHVFSYGARRIMKHQCAHCALEVTVDFDYGKQILAGGDLSRQGFNENRNLLDAVGNLFDQYLHHDVDVNKFESYLYLNSSGANGALLDVAYYRCAHCQAQYLILHSVWIKEDRPPFEPDEINIKKIYQIVLDHDDFLQAFRQVTASLTE